MWPWLELCHNLEKEREREQHNYTYDRYAKLLTYPINNISHCICSTDNKFIVPSISVGVVGAQNTHNFNINKSTVEHSVIKYR